MNDFAKGIAITVIGGLLLSWIYSFAATLTRPTIEASLNWSSFPNPAFTLDYDVSRAVTSLLGSRPGFETPLALFEKIKHNKSLVLLDLKISNIADKRSGLIEVGFPDMIAYYDGNYKIGSEKNIISIGTLDPNETQNLIFILNDFYYTSSKLLILENGVKINTISDKIDSYIDILGIAKFARDHPVMLLDILTGSWLLTAIIIIQTLMPNSFLIVQGNKRCEVSDSAAPSSSSSMVGSAEHVTPKENGVDDQRPDTR